MSLGRLPVSCPPKADSAGLRPHSFRRITLHLTLHLTLCLLPELLDTPQCLLLCVKDGSGIIDKDDAVLGGMEAASIPQK